MRNSARKHQAAGTGFRRQSQGVAGQGLCPVDVAEPVGAVWRASGRAGGCVVSVADETILEGESAGGFILCGQYRTANVNIDLYTALLGGEIIVQLSSGAKLKLKIKPETQPGTKVRIRGKGFDRGDGTFGDLIITYNVTLPTNLTERQKSLLQQMRNA